MENSLLRMYLVNASTNSKHDKVQEFFDKLGSELQNQPEWKDWFGMFQSAHPFSITILLRIPHY